MTYEPTQVTTCEFTECQNSVEYREWIDLETQTVCLSVCGYHYFHMVNEGWFDN